MPKTAAKDGVTDVLSSKFNWAGVYSSLTAEVKSKSKLSIDSSGVELNLGSFPDNPDFSSSSLPRKRARPGNSNYIRPFCQVEGCMKDLSSCKEYNKKHKVCEIHSKTAKAFVNGVEQRFCQQCSRFHSLSAFDDGKRSCRKRLAGHNERRRKNHANLISRIKFIPPYIGGTNSLETSFESSSASSSSFSYPNVLHLRPPQTQGINNWNRNSSNYTAASHGINNMNSRCKSSLFRADDELLIPLVTRTRKNKHYITSSFLTNMSSSDFDSLSLNQQQNTTPPIVVEKEEEEEDEEVNVLDNSSSFPGQQQQQPSSSSGCALSLLSSSSQSQTQPPPYISSNTNPTSHYSIVQISGNLPSTSAYDANIDSLLITDEYNEFIPRSSGRDDSTIHLLELSTQFHNDVNERQSIQMKPDDHHFFGLRIT